MPGVKRQAKRVATFVVGMAVLIAGIAMLALPGPGIMVIIAALVILATEFEWAERLLDTAVEWLAETNNKLQASRRGQMLLAASGIGLILVGIGVIMFWTKWAAAGGFMIFTGIISLITLHPKVRTWVEERAHRGINSTDDVAPL